MAVEHDTVKMFWVSGQPRWVSVGLWDKLEGPKPPSFFKSNGCSYSPDYVLGKPIWPACVIHDWHYHSGGPDISQKRADRIFAKNVYVCLVDQGVSPIVAGVAAGWRWSVLTRLGQWVFKNG